MVCAFFIIFVSAKSFSFQLIIFSFKFMYIDTHSHIYEEEGGSELHRSAGHR